MTTIGRIQQYFRRSASFLTRFRLRLIRLQRLVQRASLPIFAVSIGILLLPYIMAGDLYDYQDTVDGVHLPPVDAIVCLAGGRGRIAAAGDLWYRYWEARGPKGAKNVPMLYMAGMGPQSNLNVLRMNLRTGVRSVIRAKQVVIEKESFNTEANAQWFAQHLSEQLKKGEKGWQRVILITSPYHMRRARWIFEQVLQKQGVEVRLETHSAFQEPFENDEWRMSLHGSHVTVLEYLKWLYYRYFWKA